MSLEHNDIFSIGQCYARYAKAIDEKRFESLDQVFHPEAALLYVVGPHEFSCTGGDCSTYFGEFLTLCYWTNHLIAAPLLEAYNGGVKSSARVIATHIQHLENGGENRWTLRGSYHDHFEQDNTGWRITHRFCVCPDSEGEFLDSGVVSYPELAWADAKRL